MEKYSIECKYTPLFSAVLNKKVNFSYNEKDHREMIWKIILVLVKALFCSTNFSIINYSSYFLKFLPVTTIVTCRVKHKI